jgi:hypothetical protein
VIRGALLGERVVWTEAVGQALAEYGDELGDSIIDDVRGMIEAAVAELRDEFAKQIDELSGRIDSTQTQGAELKAELDKIIARRRRAKAAKANGERLPSGEPLLLPSPANGHAQ